MTLVYIVLVSSIVINTVLFMLLKSSYLDNKYLTDLIDSLEEELNEEEMNK